jgi:acyl-CoA reductase-like NAD-dependent aldehyde dehydrogenase
MADQTVNPHANRLVATFDDLTNEQFAKLIVQAQKTFGSWSQRTLSVRPEVRRRAGAAVALATAHRHHRLPEEDK